jgi:ATP-dependent RNA helicase DeaD
MEKFKDLGLCEHVLKVISAKKFVEPSEIQEKTIPLVLSGKDVIAGSATGSGKTLAFGAGVIKQVEKGKGVQALILTPTRELAEQVAEALSEFSYHKGLEVSAVYGGVSIGPQQKRLAYADIVVATPGRLLDHYRQKSIDLSKVGFLVLDEADRMWDMGFKDDVGKIVNACPKRRQTLLFSATISGDLADFAGKYMSSPVEISVESYVDCSLLSQVYYDVADNEKFSLLVHLLKTENPGLAMVFCNTRRTADWVSKSLAENDIKARAIHGGMDQKKRMRVLEEFGNEKKTMNVVVCTDVAARGLDISGVSHVYNFDLPKDHRDYVHRIGRTARAGESGAAVNIVASRDYDNFFNVQRHNEDMKIVREATPSFGRARVCMMNDSRKSGRGHGRSARNNSSPRRGRADGRGRQSRGDRNKRVKRGGSRDGFRGSGRNVRKKSFR